MRIEAHSGDKYAKHLIYAVLKHERILLIKYKIVTGLVRCVDRRLLITITRRSNGSEGKGVHICLTVGQVGLGVG